MAAMASQQVRQDIERASELARNMVTMGIFREIGTIKFDDEDENPSWEETAGNKTNILRGNSKTN